MEAIVRSLPDQIIEGVEISKAIKRLKKPDCLIIGGMGGSGIAGEIFAAIYQSKVGIPIITHHSYGLPGYLSKKSLVILVSYSGNTEEVLSMMSKARSHGLGMIAITSDGVLSRKKIPIVSIPPGLPPRGAFGYLFTPLPFIAWRCGLISNPQPDLTRTAGLLKKRYDLLRQKAKKIARSFFQRFPFIYTSTPGLLPVGYRWSCQLNENAKVPAHVAYLPEMNHNEVVGLEGLRDISQETALVILRDKDETSRIIKRIEIMDGIIKGDFADIIDVKPFSGNIVSRYISLIWLGDLVSVYLARMKGVDPFAIKRIDQLKKEMKR